MLALVGTVMLRSAFGKVLLREGDGVLGTHTSRARSRNCWVKVRAGQTMPLRLVCRWAQE
jgi:hypothetical protein